MSNPVRAVSPRGVTVTLANTEYVVMPLKYNSVYKFKDMLADVLAQLDEINFGRIFAVLLQNTDETEADVLLTNEERDIKKERARVQRADALRDLDEAVNVVLQNIGKLFAIGIKGVNEDMFSPDASDEESPDVDQLWTAFNAILQVNHLDFLQRRIAQIGERLNAPTNTMPTTQHLQPLLSSMDSTPNASSNSQSPN